MRLLFLVDTRSPFACSWIRYFIDQGHEVHIISSYPSSSRSISMASQEMVPIAFSEVAKYRNALNGPLYQIARIVRYWVSPLELYRHIGRIAKIVERIRPDLVHAMRIPFEGIMAALAIRKIPLLISVWGNDFTLFAKRYPLIGTLTRRTLRRADAIHCDCLRDKRLAYSLGFDDSKPSAVLPCVGVDLTMFHPGPADRAAAKIADIPEDAAIVFNPRGLRHYVRNETFFQAIPLVLRQRPDVIFLCGAMKDDPVAKRWVRRLGIGDSVRLLPVVPLQQLADFFRLAQVTVSPSVHDGTPNTLLEAIASGCLPVMGDIESVREWIQDGVNGLLCDPNSPESLSRAIVRALEDSELRQRAREYNLKLIAQRAEYGKSMAQAEQFYQRVIEYTLKRVEDNENK